MTNTQARLIATAIALLAGAIMSTSNNIDINISIAIILIAGILLLIEHLRSQRE
jgi:uncharacterized membrane protein